MLKVRGWWGHARTALTRPVQLMLRNGWDLATQATASEEVDAECLLTTDLWGSFSIHGC